MNEFLKILLLEDSNDDQLFIRRQIIKSGLKSLFVTSDNKSTYEKLVKSFEPDLILSDYYVPGFIENEALNISKEFNPKIPFIYLTAYYSIKLEEIIKVSNADGFLNKENLNDLPKLISSILGKKNNN